MKKIILVLIIITIGCILIPDVFAGWDNVLAKTSLNGKITDKNTGEPIGGVSLYFPDLKTGSTSAADGTYRIDNLPATRAFIEVSCVGYRLVAENIDLTMITVKDFALDPSVTELHELVVTGLSKAAERNRTPTPITIIPSIQLLRNSSSNIIDAIARQPGVSQITTGSGISKPVIRGLGFNRVVTVNDGIRQEGQQWGDEHGIEIDGFSISKVEILKGPASLAYGSDAIAGVINMLPAPSQPDGRIVGNLLATVQSNNGLAGVSANIAGNRKGFIWDFRYSNKQAHAYQNKNDGYVFNSGFRENAFNGTTGLTRSWGFTHLHFSAYNLQPGIVEGDRDSLTGQFIRPTALNDTTESYVTAIEKDFKSYNQTTPFQKIGHYKAVLNSSFIIGEGSLKTIIGFQQNQRKEYADVLNKDKYGLYFLLNSLHYEFRYVLPERNNMNLSFGVNGMRQSSVNKGTEFLIPDYALFDIGVFVIARKNFDKLDISAGLRHDTRMVKGEDLYLNADGTSSAEYNTATFHQFTAFNSIFTGVSGSLGASFRFSEKVYTKLNLARGFRAPNIAEISANGVHEGTINFILGDAGLKAEQSLQFDYALGFNSEHISAEADFFSNHISNYIFQRKLTGISGSDSLTDGFSTFIFDSGDAVLTGGEISVDIHPHPLDWLHFENTFSFVGARQTGQPDSTKYLPFTPASRLTSELQATIKKTGRVFANSYIFAGISHHFKQNHFYAAFETETATPSYSLINMGIGTDLLFRNRTLMSIFLSADNITDVAYQSHLSRLKYASVNNATGRKGVYNMGRNFSLKIILPIDFSRKNGVETWKQD